MSSSDDIVLSVKNVSKCFEMYDRPVHRLLQTLTMGKKTFYKEFWALKDINFELKKGECLGVIGRNGAGKSTLLQIITGTLMPTTGSVEIKGRVAALLELGSGFNPEFSGRDNVYMNAAILGLTKKETDEKYDDILEFADIGNFIDQPVRTYSSGMILRLAFAVIAHVDADVLIIDEALSVGDALFQQKCMRFLRQFMEEKTILFVSHDTAVVINFCDKAILLENGNIKKMGSAKEVAEQYLADLYESVQGESNVTHSKQETKINSKNSDELRDMRQDFINSTNLRNDIELSRFDPNASAFGKGNARINNVLFSDEHGNALSWIIGGEDVVLKIEFTANEHLLHPIIGFHIRDNLGQDLFGDNTFLTYIDDPFSISINESCIVEFKFKMPALPVGDYSVCVAVATGSQTEHIQHQFIHDALFFKSQSSCVANGLIGIPMSEITFKQI